jgi:broad specificity phosphatase PhoE
MSIPTSPATPSPPEQPPAPQPPPSPLDRAFLTSDPQAGDLVLVRHGQQTQPTGPNVTVSDWVDPPLSELGRRQAGAVGEALRDLGVDAVYASNLQRALDTGLAIAGHYGLEPTVFPELREVEMFRDLPEDVPLVDAVDRTLLRGSRERFVHERTWDAYPFTETSAEFRGRIVTTIEGILTLHAGETVVVACHGGVINAYLAHLLRLGEDMFFRPAHASITRVRFRDGRRVVHTLNELHHLHDAEGTLVTF